MRSSIMHVGRGATCLAAVLVAGLVGCTGSIGGRPSSGDGDDGADDEAGAGGGTTVGGRGGNGGTPRGGMGGGGAGGTGGGPSACVPGTTFGPTFMHRLSNEEYDNTIRDLLGYTGRASVDFGLVPDARSGGFDTNAEAITLSTTVFDKYEEAAEKLAASSTATPAKLETLMGCKPGAAGCMDAFIKGFGRRAFRRPLEADEVTALTTLAATGTDAADSVAQVLKGVLLSPSFIHRPEVGVPDPAKPGLVRLTGYEVATRLSYVFLRTTPSVALLDAAAKGDLDTAAGVETATRDLLGRPGAKTAVATFLRQWFRLDALKGLRFEEQKYKWSSTLAASMQTETERLLEHVTWTTGVPFTDVLVAPYSFIDATLAEHYGLPAPAQPWARVNLPASSRRAGVLTHGSVLALTSKPDHVSAILRGKFVREAIMCTPIPPPPANVPALSDPLPGESEQQRFERHTKDDACAGCHQLLDPIGFGMGDYDAVGAVRELDDLGRPPDTRGTIVGDLDVTFEGAVDLGSKLRKMGDVDRCVATHAFRYALGRLERDGVDDCAIDTLSKAFVAAKQDLREMLVALATSDVFRYRASDAPTGGQP